MSGRSEIGRYLMHDAMIFLFGMPGRRCPTWLFSDRTDPVLE
jgi:hypothetical protein